MNEKDQAAFERWAKENQGYLNQLTMDRVEFAYQSGVSYERQRSANLVNLIKKYNRGSFMVDDNLDWDAWENWIDYESDEEAEAALKEYYASGEGER